MSETDQKKLALKLWKKKNCFDVVAVRVSRVSFHSPGYESVCLQNKSRTSNQAFFLFSVFFFLFNFPSFIK